MDLRLHIRPLSKPGWGCHSLRFNVDVQLGKKTDNKSNPHDRHLRRAMRGLSNRLDSNAGRSIGKWTLHSRILLPKVPRTKGDPSSAPVLVFANRHADYP